MATEMETLLAPVIAGSRRVLCCHSGVLSGDFAANTAAAIRECCEAGVPRLEFDAWVLADGDVLIFHDDFLDPASTGRGAVARKSAAEVRGLAYAGTDTQVARLTDVAADLARAIGTLIQVDLKGTAPHTPEQSRALIRALEPYLSQVLIGSQAHWNLRPLAQAGFRVALDPTWHLHAAWWAANDYRSPARLSPHGTWDDSPLAREVGVSTRDYLKARIADLHGMLPSVEWMVDWRTLFHLQDRGVALGDELASHGVALAAWTLRDEGEQRSLEMLRQLFELGAETVITEAPMALSRYLAVARW